MLFVTPEYNRGLPACLKKPSTGQAALWHQFIGRKPSAVIGASPGKIGTALAQQHLRSALSYCNSPQLSAPEAYIQFTPGLITDDGEVTDKSTEQFLHDFMDAFGVFITRVLTVLPREG